MKCIKTQNGKIERLRDKEAQQLVIAGAATYIKKSEWRKTDSEWKKRSDALKAFEANRKQKEEKTVDISEEETKKAKAAAGLKK
jgi:hypothetical protein